MEQNMIHILYWNSKEEIISLIGDLFVLIIAVVYYVLYKKSDMIKNR